MTFLFDIFSDLSPKTVNILVFFVIIGSGNAFGGELDTYYLQQFGELPSASTKVAQRSSHTKTPKKCRTHLHHNLKRDWKTLAASTQNTLAKYLAKPTWLEETFRSSNNHFVIHYTAFGLDAPPLADNDKNGQPDWVETVAAEFEVVYAKEVQAMGYKAPPNIMPYDVYLRDLGGYLGLTTSDILQGQSATSYIEIDSSFEGYYPYSPSDLLKTTAAHEFHHAIQYGYNYFFDVWFSEATATWIEDEVYDSINQIYDYTYEYLSQTTTSLNGGDFYSRWIFNRSLSEQYESTDIIRNIWESLALEPAPYTPYPPYTPYDIPMLPFIDTVLKSQGGSLAASFFGFAKQIYLRNWSSHTDDVGLIPFYTPVATYSTLPVNNSTSSLPSYAFAYYRFIPGNTTPANLHFTFLPAENLSITAFKKTATGVVTEYPLSKNSGTLIIDSFNGAGVSEVALLICNASPEPTTASFKAEGSQLSAKPGDCNYDGTVTISEVQSAINMFLGMKPVIGCVDTSGDNSIASVEVQQVINSFLGL